MEAGTSSAKRSLREPLTTTGLSVASAMVSVDDVAGVLVVCAQALVPKASIKAMLSGLNVDDNCVARRRVDCCCIEFPNQQNLSKLAEEELSWLSMLDAYRIAGDRLLYQIK